MKIIQLDLLRSATLAKQIKNNILMYAVLSVCSLFRKCLKNMTVDIINKQSCYNIRLYKTVTGWTGKLAALNKNVIVSSSRAYAHGGIRVWVSYPLVGMTYFFHIKYMVKQ